MVHLTYPVMQEECHQNFKVKQVCQGCIHLQYICNSCASGVHLTLHLSRRCTAVVVLLQQGVLLGSLWVIYSLHSFSKAGR